MDCLIVSLLCELFLQTTFHSASHPLFLLLLRFVNEAAKCLEDEIIADPVVGDIGLVFGTGFAPFRGGPFRYLDQYGVSKYVDMMNGLADTYGPQFEPCQILKDHAASNKKFHGGK